MLDQKLDMIEPYYKKYKQQIMSLKIHLMVKLKSRVYLLLLLVFLGCFSVPDSLAQTFQLDLSGKWKVCWNDGNHGPNNIDWFYNINPLVDTLRYMDVDVPMDLNIAMQKKGLSGDLNYGSNYLSSRWVAEQIWQYYKRFNVPDAAIHQSAQLVFDRLDYAAKIFLNGEEIAQHNNAFIPCIVDVSGKLKPGENILTVGIESGLYEVADKSLLDYNNIANLNVHLNKRHWLRKPQYQFSWDWNPTLINIGITGDVSLRWYEYARIENIVPWIKMSDDLSSAQLTVRTFIERAKENSELSIAASLIETGQEVAREIPVGKGVQAYELKMDVAKPELWWPVGQGDPKLYTLKVDIKLDGKTIDSDTRKIGFRKIEVDQSKHPEEGSYFTIRINDRPIFMKGGNWVPADMIYSQVDRKKTEELINLAVDANFNMLRIWGGGLFAGDDFLELCDEKGLLVWHDFLFACSKYPGDDVDFYRNVKKEVSWAVRKFAYHPSLVVWGGNNELELGAWWGYADANKVIPDYNIFHHLIPVILKQESPYNHFYWPSSPYSANHESPNSPIHGDQHPWGVSLQKDTTNIWAYREYVDRFPNEGGVLGASSPATLRQFLPENEQYMRSFTWDLHDNSVNFSTEKEGITYRFVKDWLGVSYTTMDFDQYVFASGLLHAEGLSEYINNYHRRMYSSSSAIFWMYNDSWPVTHGWTIVDYYLRKKLAYHPVRRAFEQISTVVTAEENRINIYGINEQKDKWRGNLQYGVFKTDGELAFNKTSTVTLPPNASTLIASFDRSILEEAGLNEHGAFAVLNRNNVNVFQHRLFLSKFKDLSLLPPDIHIETKGNQVSISSPVYVWGVVLDMEGESNITDNCFDLLPGVPYIFERNENDEISVKMTGNDLMLQLNK